MIPRDFFKLHIVLLLVPVILGSCLLPGMAQHDGSPGFTGRQGHEGNGEENRTDLLTCIREKHGPDPGLINGIQYINRYYRMEGHPYYGRETSIPGSVTLSGRQYQDLSLNYDLYAQHLVLRYEWESGGVKKIVLVPEHTDAFSLDGDQFERLSLTEDGPRFYQVIRAGEITCFIHWKKEMVPTSNDLLYTYYFARPRGDYWMEYDGKLRQFSNRRTFRAIFPKEQRKEVGRYMRRHRFRFREATTGELTGLLEFIVKLSQPVQEE